MRLRPDTLPRLALEHSLGLLWLSAYGASHCPGPGLGLGTLAGATLCYGLQGIRIHKSNVCSSAFQGRLGLVQCIKANLCFPRGTAAAGALNPRRAVAVVVGAVWMEAAL